MDLLDLGANHEMVVRYHEPPGDDVAKRNRQVFVEALDALVAGDADAFWSIFDPDVVFHEAACLPYGGSHHGVEATKRAFGHMVQTYSSMYADLEAVLASRDIVMLYQTIKFRVRENGNEGTLPVSEMYRFRDGKVVEWRALYFDADLVARAIRGN
jgi:ketosteroid isomerase-like protein